MQWEMSVAGSSPRRISMIIITIRITTTSIITISTIKSRNKEGVMVIQINRICVLDDF